MRNVVFWSGGQDSTLVAVQLLRAGEHVDLVSFDNCWIGGEHQQNKEKMWRKRTLQKFQEEFGGNKFKHHVYTWDGDLKGTINQDSFWAPLFPLCCQDKDKAYFGVIEDDPFWHYKKEFEEVFNSICKLHKKEVEIKYPLEWRSRKSIIKDLKKFGYLDFALHSGDKL